ncbi:hypothetical protein DL770_006061 [Monosporascus sp. CRB-9-2]|nr:hypothetical protein DL770_006061 [Monosporascus sp. CRB-9-2]
MGIQIRRLFRDPADLHGHDNVDYDLAFIVILFDSDLDTYIATQARPPQYAGTQDSPLPPFARRTGRPKVFGGSPLEVASINHGTHFYHAAREGLLANDSNAHAGIRTMLSGPSGLEHDGYRGFEIDSIGAGGIIGIVAARIGTSNPVYLSLDTDTLGPTFAPATGTPETGGWSTRELRAIMGGLEDVNLTAVDVPAYDTNAEHTTITAADALYEIMSFMLKKGTLRRTVAEDGDDKGG